jgi:hypothetical protein
MVGGSTVRCKFRYVLLGPEAAVCAWLLQLATYLVVASLVASVGAVPDDFSKWADKHGKWRPSYIACQVTDVWLPTACCMPGKSYATADELSYRREVFNANVRRMEVCSPVRTPACTAAYRRQLDMHRAEE